MKITMKKIDDLIPYEDNPRNNDEAVEYVANSIKEFGFKVPIVIDSHNVIVAGHTRLKASEKLGLNEVPCIIADDLTPEQVRAYRLADNKTAGIAEWDWNALAVEMDDIEIDMEAFGFDVVTVDGFDDEFSLSDLDRPQSRTMTFTLAEEQFELVNHVLDSVDGISVGGNTNTNGNKLYEVVLQWENQPRT